MRSFASIRWPAYEEPDSLNERTPTQTDSTTPKADHADTPAGLTTPVPPPKGATDRQPGPLAPPPRPKQARDHQPGPIAPLLRPKRGSGQRKAAHLKSQQWEIRKIVGKRRTRRGWEYKVVWARSWLPRSELGDAQRLLGEFEMKDSAQQKSRCDRSARDSGSGV